MFHDLRTAKAVQEQKLRDAQRCLEKDLASERAEKRLWEKAVAHLVALLHTWARDARNVKASKSDRKAAV